MQLIKPIVRGSTDTLLTTERANQLIDIVNKIATARVVVDPGIPTDKSRLAFSDSDAVFIIGTKTPQ